MRSWGYALALLAVHICTVAAQSTDSLDAQNVFNLEGTVYNRTGALLPLHFNLYQIPVPANETNPDILITLNSTTGGTGLALYCNPQYGQYAGGSYPGPGNAIWQSELSSRTNQIFISKNDPYYRSSATNSSVTQIPFLCSVINSDVNTTTNYTLDASIVSDNRTLNSDEQNALASLFARCCSNDGSCNFWKALNQANSTNANGGTVLTDFCTFPGQICSPTGRLYRLDLGGYNLSCAWPGQQLAAFSQLSTLSLEQNTRLTANMSDVFSTVANNMTGLQFLVLDSNTNITGVLENGTTKDNLCKAVQSDLASISMASMGIQGAIPSCLYTNSSKVIALDLSNNQLTGSLSDSIPPGSPLQLLRLQENRLTGVLPSSLDNATYLVDINVTNNQLSGSIPEGVGAIVPLQSFQAAMNNLSGPIPDSFGTAQNLETFDVKLNQLTSLPAAWTNASFDAYNSSFTNIRASYNNISGPFPAGLANAQQLGYLVLNVNNISGSLPSNDSMFIGLRAINISYNALTGTIPPQFNSTGIFSAAPIVLLSGRPLQQIFDLSFNKLTGSLPSFLNSSSVPPWTQDGIYLQGNNLTVDCNNASFSYLTSVCPNGNMTTNSTQVPLETPSATPRGTPVQGAAAGIPSLPSPPATTTTGTATSSSESQKGSGDGGLSSGAIAGIVVGVLVAIALAALVGLLVLRRRRKEPMMPRNYDSSTFSMPNFGDGEFGRKSSLRKGLASMQSGQSGGFERFDDEPQGHVELAHNGAK